MAMNLDTAIRLSAQVTGGANIDRVKRSIQELAGSSKTSARDMAQLRSATFQLARANEGTIAGIRNSISAFRGLQEQARIGSREFRRYGQEIQQLEAKLRGLDGAADKAGDSLAQKVLGGVATAGIGQALRGITAQAGRFDAEVRRAAAIEGGADTFEVLRKEIEAVAAQAAGTPTEVAALTTSLSRAGFSARETTEALRGIVLGAEATSITFEEMGSIAADNLRAFGLQTSETQRVVDVLTQTANKSNQTVLDLGESMKYAAPIARNLGVPLEDLSATMALLANNGIRGSDAGTALRTGLTRLQIAASGSNEELEGLTRGNVLLAKAMRSLGAEIIDTRGNLLPMDQVILSLRKNIQSLSAGRRAEIAKALFGDEAGSKFLALLNSSEAQIRQMFAAVRNSGGVAEETQRKMQGFDYSVKVLGGNVEYLTNQIGGMIGVALQPLINELNNAISAAQKLPKPIKDFGAAAAAAGIATVGFAVAVNTLKTALSIVGGIKGVTAALTGYTAAATAAGGASAAAATQVTRLAGVLGTLGKIGLITIGVKFVVEGLDQLLTGLVGVESAEKAARQMAARRGLTYSQSEAVKQLRAAQQKAGPPVPERLLRQAAAAPVPSAAAAVIATTTTGGGGKAAADKAASEADQRKKEQERAQEEARQLEASTQQRLRSLIRENELVSQTALLRQLQFEAERANDKELLIRLQGEEQIMNIMQRLSQELDGITDERIKQNTIGKATTEIEIARQDIVLNLQRLEDERTKKYEEILADLELELKLKQAVTEEQRDQIRLEADLKRLRGEDLSPEQIDTITQRRKRLAEKDSPELAIKKQIGAIQEDIAKLTDAGNMAIAIGGSIGDSFADAFKGIISGSMSAKEALGGFFQSVADAFLDMAAQIISKWITMTILNQVLKLFPGGDGGGAGMDWSVVDKIAPGYANGGAFTANGIVPFARGGVVNTPTLFQFANGGALNTGVMGEAGPEAILPLKRDSSGRLGVSAEGTGGSSPVTVNVAVDATGSSVQGDPGRGQQLGRVIAAAVQAELVKQKRPGGILA